MKYLGVPLLSTQLKQSHCQSLIAKITCKISSWMVQHLSYAGRLQLIQSVLQSLHIYWCSIFVLPKAVIHEIESICRNFLWHGHYEGKHYYPVSWDSVCTPKCEGGLGLKRVYDWNIASIIRFIWDIVSEKDSLWARWVIDTKLKRLSFWGLTKPHDASWIWSLLLKIRNLAKPMFEYNLGKGSKFHFWGDPWAHNVAVEDLFPDASVRSTDIPKSTLLSDLWSKNRWRIPDAVDTASESLRQFVIDNFHLTNQEDCITWRLTHNGVYSVSSAWNFIQTHHSKVPWFRILWGQMHIPRHSFICWLAMKKRLATKNRLLKWRLVNDASCCFCGYNEESLNHLFFDCCFTTDVWKKVLFACQINRNPLSFNREVSWFSKKASGKSLLARTRRIAFCATIYYLWQAINESIFQQIVPDSQVVFVKIKNALLLRFCSQQQRARDAVFNFWM